MEDYMLPADNFHNKGIDKKNGACFQTHLFQNFSVESLFKTYENKLKLKIL